MACVHETVPLNKIGSRLWVYVDGHSALKLSLHCSTQRTLSSAARHGQLEFSTDEIHYFDATQMDNPAVASVLLFIYLLFIYLSIYLLRCLIIELEW